MILSELARIIDRRFVGPASLLVAFSAEANRAVACAVCYGDPESPLAKGATAGVLFLMGVVGVVLVTIAGTGMYWMHRSRQIAHIENANPEVREDTDS